MPAEPRTDVERSSAALLVRRLLAGSVVVALVVAAVLARRSGIDAAAIERWLVELGWLGPPLFILLFAAGELLHLPGILFVVAARLVFGPALGFVIGYLGALFAVNVSFTLARVLFSATRASRQPWRPRWRFLQRAFDRVEDRPIITVALLRLILWLTPPLSYALALTPLRARDHAVGSALGLVLPVLAAVLIGGVLRP